MFAVVKTGGKQYKVSVGDVISIEKQSGTPGQQVSLSEILMVADDKGARVGAPLLANSEIKATVLEQMRTRKVLVYKKRRRQGYDRMNGHRQHMTVIHIDEIIESGKSLAKQDAPAARIRMPRTETSATTASVTKTQKTTAKKVSSTTEKATAEKKATSSVKKTETATSEKKASTTQKTETTEKKTTAAKKPAAAKKSKES